MEAVSWTSEKMTSLGVTAIIMGIVAALAFGGGFAVSNWRAAAEIQRLNSINEVAYAANDKCAQEIESVRASMSALTAASARREKNAAQAMRGAAAEAAKHVARAKETRSLQPVLPVQQFEVLAREQIEYVKRRHQDH